MSIYPEEGTVGMNIAQISIVNSIKLLYNGEILPVLLIDRTTRNNIVWATDEYKTDNNRLTADKSIDIIDITGEFSNRIRPRYSKTLESQKDRTKRKAEVFTPAWICNRMNNDFDEEYLGYKNAFNIPNERTWETTSTPIVFNGNRNWKEYANLTRLEITCGEAPFVTSRYYPATGEMIAISNRIGFLDRKLRVVAENTEGTDYLKWSLRALQSSYGYEYQGDNLLIARINVFMTWYESYVEKTGEAPSIKDAKEAAKIISWNFWQMDGLTGAVPTKPLHDSSQISIFELMGDAPPLSKEETYSKIFDWRLNRSQTYNSLKGDS